MRFLAQTRVNNAGQTCAAIVTGKPIEYVELAMGTRSHVTYRHIRQYLREEGVHFCNQKQMRFKDNPPINELSIVRVNLLGEYETCKHHWIVMDRRYQTFTLIYDPLRDKSIPLTDWLVENPIAKLTSYIVVKVR